MLKYKMFSFLSNTSNSYIETKGYILLKSDFC